jgi:glucose-6-phosphate isomerase
MPEIQGWDRFRKYLFGDPETGLSIDISRMNFRDDFFQNMEPRIRKSFSEMKELEQGSVANPDEKRMVGHYWLRNAALAPSPAIAAEINFTVRAVIEFAADVHSGTVSPPTRTRFTRFLVIGIGGSALGPQFIADALGSANDAMRPYFFDNTDPDGFDRTLAEIGTALGETLCVVISKSGGTKETRNGMVEAKAAYAAAGLDFPRHAVAVTGRGSELDTLAVSEGWLNRFPMWDWVGGRTSVTSAVGLLPAALQGFDIESLLKGANLCDILTRRTETSCNPAALVALMWYHGSRGTGEKDMVVLPYKDRLLLFPRYLQQLVMESLGKGEDANGNVVRQGLAVYGNKGSTDQHAYVQQLREGVDNFFVTFIEVLKDRTGTSPEVEEGITSGDYLEGFLLGTREALSENGRESMTITIPRIDPLTVGMLIALYERAVGLYASLVGINAYNQPGVEAGKKAAGKILALQKRVLEFLREERKPVTVTEIAKATGGDPETIFLVLRHLSSNPDHRIVAVGNLLPETVRYHAK